MLSRAFRATSTPRRVSSRYITLIMKTSTTTNTSNVPYPTFGELLKDVRNKMGIDVNYTLRPKDRSHLMKFLPETQEELPKRSMENSFLAAVIPLSTDMKLRDKYVTFLGHVRVGRLLENMDMFAVLVAEKHIVNPKVTKSEDYPYVFVTAIVDKIDFTDFVPKVFAVCGGGSPPGRN